MPALVPAVEADDAAADCDGHDGPREQDRAAARDHGRSEHSPAQVGDYQPRVIEWDPAQIHEITPSATSTTASAPATPPSRLPSSTRRASRSASNRNAGATKLASKPPRPLKVSMYERSMP